MDYISRDAARAIIEEQQKAVCYAGRWGRGSAIDVEKYDALEAVLDAIDAVPAADVAPVRHGLRYRTGEIRACAGLVEIQCSECEETNLFDVIRYKTSARYCPYCGAKWERGAYNG